MPFFKEAFFMNETEGTILFAMCVAAAVCTMLMIATTIAVVVVLRRRKAAPKRELTDLFVDASAAELNFIVGGDFRCDGLKIAAHYTLEPRTETLAHYKIVSQEEFARLETTGGTVGCYVVKPSLSEIGETVVAVKYMGKTAYYTVSVSEAEERNAAVSEEPETEEVTAPEKPMTASEEVVYEEFYEGGTLRYDKSFTARYIQSDDALKNWYTTLKNELLSYKKVRSRISWKRETFRMGREAVARLSYRGKTLCIYLPLNPADYAESKYKVEDVSEQAAYADTPCMYRLKNERRVRYAIELFATVMERMGAVRIERISEDYYLPYEGLVQLIEKGLVKRVIKGRSDELIFLQSQISEAAATVAETQEPVAETVVNEKEEAPAEEQEETPEEVLENAEEQAEEPAVADGEATIDEVVVSEEQTVAVAEETADGETVAETEELPIEEQTKEIST